MDQIMELRKQEWQLKQAAFAQKATLKEEEVREIIGDAETDREEYYRLDREFWGMMQPPPPGVTQKEWNEQVGQVWCELQKQIQKILDRQALERGYDAPRCWTQKTFKPYE
jgi:hypothetical protein